MNRKRAISVQSKLDIIQLTLNIIIGLVLIPYYLKFITVELYGLWLATSGVIVLLDLLDLGITTVFVERISKFYSKKKFEILLDYFYSGIFLYVLIALIILLFGLALTPFISFIFQLGANDQIIENCFKIAVLTSSLKVFNSGLSNFGSAVLEPLNYSLIRIVSLIFSIILIINLLQLNYGLLSLAFGYMAQQLFSFIFNIFFSLKIILKINSRFLGKIRCSILKDFFSSLKYLFFARSAESLVKNIEPVIIGSMIGAETTAVYVFGKKISDIIYQFVNIFTGASYASLINISQINPSEQKDSRIQNLSKLIFYLAVIFLSFYISLNKDFLNFWVGKNFEISVQLSTLFALSALLMIWFQFKTVLLFSKNLIKHVSKILFFEAIFRCLLLIILINQLDIYGGPAAIIISTSLGILFLDKYFKIDKFSLIICFLFFSASILLATIDIQFLPLINILIKAFILSIVLLSGIILSKKFRLDLLTLLNYIWKK